MASATKVNQRKGHRAFATKMIKEVQTLLAADDIDEGKLFSIEQTLSEKLRTLSTLDDEILDTLEEEDAILNEIDKSSEIRVQIQESVISIKSLGGKGRRGSQILGTSFTPNFMNSSTNNAKLPKLSIKPFSGNPLEYQSFWDSFEAAIDSNGYLDDVVKFNYLKSFLKGQALNAVEGLSLTSENYKEAVAILDTRYGNKQLLITSHIEK